ncbi:MAG: LacI family DNA-binding transcriptional regulator [Anaerolineales bacterium]
MQINPVTRKQVAERAGVSVAVVSYVVNDGPRPVAPETRIRVERAIDELGYYPNELARSLSRKQTAIIGLIIPSLVNPVYAEIADSLTHYCAAEGYRVILGSSGRDHQNEVEFAKSMRAKQVDGVVMIPSESPEEILEPLQHARIPTVVLEHELPNTHCIAIDDLQGGQLATKHLLSLGHGRIGMIKRKPTSALSHLRYSGFRDTLRAAGIPLDPAVVVESEAGQAGGYASMQKLLALSQRPTAVFAHNDVLAMGAISAIYHAGLTVPHDISIVGYDDTIQAAYFNPPLTTVKLPIAEMGRAAGKTILELVKNGSSFAPQTTILPVELIVRNSTAQVRADSS